MKAETVKHLFCPACHTTTVWQKGIALENGLYISSDFPGDYSGPAENAPTTCSGQTMSHDDNAALVPVWKCSECGKSVRRHHENL